MPYQFSKNLLLFLLTAALSIYLAVPILPHPTSPGAYKEETQTVVEIKAKGKRDGVCLLTGKGLMLGEVLEECGYGADINMSEVDPGLRIQNGMRIEIDEYGRVIPGDMDGSKRMIFFLPININSSGAEELENLKGIGPVLAGRIVEYRENFGDFKDVNELLKVKGIGKKKLLKIRENIRVK